MKAVKCNYIISGSEAKYQLTIDCQDFDQRVDDFSVVIRWGLQGTSMTIDRSKMFYDEEGNCFFTFTTAGMVGALMAECTYYVPDSDYPEGFRKEIDAQIIGCVVTSPCRRRRCCMAIGCADSKVQYKRIGRSDANSLYMTLRTSEGDALTTSDGSVLKVKKEEKDIY